MKRYYIWPFGSCSAPCLFFYLSNARRFYSSMGKLCSLMGLTIWNTRHTGWQSGNYFVTTVCCFPCTGKVPCILATFDYDTINPLSCRGRLYERWISYPVDKSYPMDKSPIQWIAICRIKMRCTKHG